MPKGIYKRIKPPNRKGAILSEETKRKVSEGHKGKKHSEETKKKMSQSRIGHQMSEDTRKKLSEANKRRVKNGTHNLWKGGISFKPYSIDWTETLRRSIRERDNYICNICSQYGNTVHHIDYDKKNCNPNNLITLCRSCHTKTNSNRNYWIEILKIYERY